jgi:hypothetical protein
VVFLLGAKMIDAVCHTSLDEYKCVKWPTKFVALPRHRERVEGVRFGPGPGTHPVLYVVGITHKMGKPEPGEYEGKPYIEVELHHVFVHFRP